MYAGAGDFPGPAVYLVNLVSILIKPAMFLRSTPRRPPSRGSCASLRNFGISAIPRPEVLDGVGEVGVVERSPSCWRFAEQKFGLRRKHNRIAGVGRTERS